MMVSTVSCQALPSFIASSVNDTHCSTLDTIPSAVVAKCRNNFLISLLLFYNTFSHEFLSLSLALLGVFGRPTNSLTSILFDHAEAQVDHLFCFDHFDRF